MNRAHAAEFSRYAKALAAGAGSYAERVAAAEAQRATPRVVEAIKAASPAALLSSPTWAGNLAGAAGEMSVAFIEHVRPRSIFYTLAGLTTPAPFHSRIVATAMIAAAAHDESTWMPVQKAAFGASPLTPVSVGSIVVASTELARSSDPGAFGMLRAEMERGAVLAVDARAYGLAVDGITPTAATASPLADLRALLTTVNTTGAGRLMFAAAPDAANTAATVETGEGARVFPDMTPQGGRLLGIDAIVSDGVPAGRIALFDATGFATNAGAISVDLAEGGALQMKDDPADEATTLVSLFQTDSVALRIVASFGIRRERATAAAVLTGVVAAWTPEET